MAKVQFYGTGRRKKAIARVRLVPGEGKVLINDRSMDDYFGLETLKVIVKQPLVLTDTTSKFDALCKVVGGGFRPSRSNQTWNIKSILKADEELRAVLKKAGFLTRDPRMKERKKYGLKKARKAPQFSKR